MKIALVHDFLLYWGGAERVLQGIHEMFPEAPLYTLFHNPEFTKRFFPNANIRASSLQSFRFAYKFFLPFLPTSIEYINFDDYDVVISSGTFAKGIITKPQTLHIHYCHTPPRFLWEEEKEYITHNVPFGLKRVASFALTWLRAWDRVAAKRPDVFIVNSAWTAMRIKKFYGRASQVVYPFVKNVAPKNQHLKLKNTKQYFLIVSRLQRYKHIELAIRVFNDIALPLVIVGKGSDARRLMRIARGNVLFLGFQDERALPWLYSHAKAVILPGIEDFGLTLIEAMSYGTPALAYRKGGALETMIEGKTGEFFEAQHEESFFQGLKNILIHSPTYKREDIKKHAQNFSFKRFKQELLAAIERGKRA